MPLEQQVCLLELAQRLKELGVPQEGLFNWMWYQKKTTQEEEWDLDGCGGWGLISKDRHSGRSWNREWDTRCVAFTVAELGEMLPPATWYTRKMFVEDWTVLEETSNGLIDKGVTAKHMNIREATEADARAKLLIYLIEQKSIDPTKL